MNTRTKTAGLIAAAAAAAALVAGCSTDDSGTGHSMDSMSMPMSASAPAASASHNAADTAWVQMMIPHHQQAVQMAALADGRTQNAQLLALAGQIKAAQDPEIEQMSGWLTEWGVPPMAAGMDHSSHGMSGDMGGMMSADQMSQLEKATGADFDRAWLEMMIEHHQGAIDSSKQIQADGQSEQVRELAGKIIAGQQAEIEQMNAMLGK
ncbi:DUF305 domain-containing protein [Rhodococcus spelaei]|uniref:DUF305 domain-containing protein n=1 Tax=Rhodococcus spelaei TaxID=2546320 RepID=A0A541AZS2_9NOCA|nr:DUF305 domain-containing protein [Rhodococcus spelaei]TQF65571.1 DUF305 domain-containing protein [Rhodococcus spelaei]